MSDCQVPSPLSLAISTKRLVDSSTDMGVRDWLTPTHLAVPIACTFPLLVKLETTAERQNVRSLIVIKIRRAMKRWRVD